MEEHSPPQYLKLLNGEDIICDCVELSDSIDNKISFQVTNPLKVIYVPSNTGGIHIGLAPWVTDSITGTSSFILKEEVILLKSNVSEKMSHCYRKAIDDMLNVEEEFGEDMNEDYDEEDEEHMEIPITNSSNRTYH